VGSVITADRVTALGDMAVEGTTEGIAQPGEARELLIDVAGVHMTSLKQRFLDNKRPDLL
jgi:hypothetical protein